LLPLLLTGKKGRFKPGGKKKHERRLRKKKSGKKLLKEYATLSSKGKRPDFATPPPPGTLPPPPGMLLFNLSFEQAIDLWDSVNKLFESMWGLRASLNGALSEQDLLDLKKILNEASEKLVEMSKKAKSEKK
jgi:hypothetical protein